jgi:hypothetical protein
LLLHQRIQTKRTNKKSSSFADYDMVQAETRWIRKHKYDAKQNTLVTVFNNYFGGGMGSIVFQTIRETCTVLWLLCGSIKENDLYYYMDM